MRAREIYRSGGGASMAACCARGGLTNWATQMQAELGRLEGILVKIGLDHCLLGRLACCLCSAR